jgi:UDP-N-acetylmuramate--alanine ligase
MKVHFVGIGGIGVSALAKIHIASGSVVTGSDLCSSEIITDLRKQGVKIFLKHKADNIRKGTDVVIYSPAVSLDNPEIIKAQQLKIPTLSYPQALGELTGKYFTIAVSGSHGKSTTSAMLALVLIKAGLDPTVIIGTKLKEFRNSNARLGKSRYLLIEADEYAASFLNYFPEIIVVLNIDREHLDFYKDLNHIKRTFVEYVGHLPQNGHLVTNYNDKNCQILKAANINYFRLDDPLSAEISSILQVPGQHNVGNALAVLQVAKILNINKEVAIKALGSFKGSWRRFEIKKRQPYYVISDYAHHPTEVKAVLQAARQKFARNRIIIVFQPHQKQRLQLLFKEFTQAFDLADVIILTDVYQVAGREKSVNNISSEDLASDLARKKKDVYYAPKLADAAKCVKKIVKKQDIVLVVGAGDIYKLSTERKFKII